MISIQSNRPFAPQSIVSQWLVKHSPSIMSLIRFQNAALLRVASVSGLALMSLMPALASMSLQAAEQTVRPLAPIINESIPTRIPNQYIVVFKPGIDEETVRAAQEKVKGLSGRVYHTYDKVLRGFSVTLPEGTQGDAALQHLRSLPGVEYIEVDQVGSLNTIQNNPPTGLDRSSERFLPLDNRYTYSETGTGVHVYVIDTGIRATHTDFGGRVSGGTNTMSAAAGTDDCHGHGTHVAATIGGTDYGIAKDVSLHPVRAGDCINTYLAPVIDAVDWVTANRVLPAVANLSSTFFNSPTLNTAVTTSMTAPSLVTYVVAAGNSTADACNYSPALVPDAITVGAVDPANDTRAGFSNFGTCLDLFGPGVDILSAGIAHDTATDLMDGTSMAAPHVAGVAARYLETHPAATPADVWMAIHDANNVLGTTAGWTGVVDAGTGSPNELLHWGSLNDGFNDGDPHLTTVDGVHYDFQSAGEFVALRGGGLEIQTRQTPISTTFLPGPNPYTGLPTCAAVNTAVAARVGTHRVTYQPGSREGSDAGDMQLRVDGKLVDLGPEGIDLTGGGHIQQSPVGDGIEVLFPNGTRLIATPGWWASQSLWYLNVDVYDTTATEGIMGYIASGSWLPALPDGSSVGSKPATLHDRYVDLYGTFADAWRVTDSTSLFDYAPGTSAAGFVLDSWPRENPSDCTLPEQPPVEPASAEIAEEACRNVAEKNSKANCLFDVTVTGNLGFAETYLLSEELEPGRTSTRVDDAKDPTRLGERAIFTATVRPIVSRGEGSPTGAVQFVVDGRNIGDALALDGNGRAVLRVIGLSLGTHEVSAKYAARSGSPFLSSQSTVERHTVARSRTHFVWVLIGVLFLVWAWLRYGRP